MRVLVFRLADAFAAESARQSVRTPFSAPIAADNLNPGLGELVSTSANASGRASARQTKLKRNVGD